MDGAPDDRGAAGNKLLLVGHDVGAQTYACARLADAAGAGTVADASYTADYAFCKAAGA